MNYNFECKLKVITPLFMGGANQQPELRTQSINGLLRWWFRVAGGSFEDEKRIFGWAGETSNQGLVRIHLNVPDLSPSDFSSTGLSGYKYLGFSLRRTRRKAIPENTEFEVRILFHPKSTEGDIKKFFCALWLAFNLGNFGSRARRGFGSIKIESIIENGKNKANSCFDLNNCFDLSFVPSGNLGDWVKQNLEKIKEILNSQGREDIPYIFGDFEIYKVEKVNYGKYKDWLGEVQNNREGKYLKNSWSGNSLNSWENFLDFMGFLLMAYRSYREPDYNNAKSILQGERVNDTTFERAIFGLPLNFFYSSLENPKTRKRGYGGRVDLKQGDETLRRASPLVIKIIQNQNDYEGLFVVMKSTFRPQNSELTFSNIKVNLPSIEWQALDDFISTLKSHNLIRRIYP